MKMRRLSLLMVLMFTFLGCAADEQLTAGKYIVDDEFTSSLILYEDGTFILNGPLVISYSPSGDYIVQKGKLVLTAAGEEEYLFTIKDGRLIFEKGEWLENWIDVGTEYYLDGR